MAEVAGALRQDRVVAVRQLQDEALCIGHARCGPHFVVRRIEPAVADVLHHARAEQIRLLQHQAEHPAQLGLPHVAQIHAVDLDRAIVDLVEAREQVDDRGLARTGRADERDALTGPSVERHVVDDLRAGHVAERDVIERDVALHRRGRPARGRVVALGGCVEDLEDALGSGQSSLERVVEVGDLPQRLHEVLTVVHERRDDADADQPVEREPSTEPDEDDHEEVPEHGRERHQKQRVRVGRDARSIDALVLRAERRDGGIVALERGDDLLTRERLLHRPVERAEMLLQLAEAAPREDGDEAREAQHDRHDEQRCEREPTIEHEHRDDDADHRHDARDQRRDVLRDRLVDRVDVVGEPAHQIARRVTIEVRHRQRLEMPEEIVAQATQRALRDPGHEPARARVERVRDHVGTDHETRDRAQPARIAARHVAVDRTAHQVRARETEQRRRDDAHEHERERRQRIVEVGREPPERAARISRARDHHAARASAPRAADTRSVARSTLAHAPSASCGRPAPSCES